MALHPPYYRSTFPSALGKNGLRDFGIANLIGLLECVRLW